MSVQAASPEPYAGRGFDIVRILAPVRRALGLGRVARSALLGFAVGAAVGTALLLARHIQSFGLAVPFAIAAAAAGVVAGVVFAVFRWPGPVEAARVADLHFGLSDRLTTALELRSSQTPVAVLQRQNVAQSVHDLPLVRSRGPWLARRDAAAAVLAALLFAAALAFGPAGGRRHAVASAPSSAQKTRHAAAAQVKALSASLQKGLTPAQLQSPSVRKLQLALSRLQRQLLNASSQRNALRAISATQQQLRQLAAGLHPINGKAVAQLNSSLSRYLGSSRAGSKSRTQTQTSPPSAQATAQALSRLAQSLAHLTPAQRAALARALAQASNTTSNNSLRSGLRQAAQALASGDPQSASASLRQTAQALSQSAALQATLSQLGAAGTQLTTLKGQIAGLNQRLPGAGTTPGKSGALTGARGRGAGQRSGLGRGAGRKPGQGQGVGARGRGTGRRAGQGQGTGRRNGQGTATRQGTARGVSGARGAGGIGRANPTASTRAHVTVYIPGKQGKGTQALLTGPNGAPVPGAIVPYGAVIGQYSQSAHQALDRAALPPSLQSDVLRYFNALSH